VALGQATEAVPRTIRANRFVAVDGNGNIRAMLVEAGLALADGNGEVIWRAPQYGLRLSAVC
jgi:hypothetical protein